VNKPADVNRTQEVQGEMSEQALTAIGWRYVDC